jgi:5-methylcytosine-specific restriction endonuclease McrA
MSKWEQTTLYRRLRPRVLRRDRYTCQECGYRDPSGKTLETHHTVARATGGQHSMDTLVTLCRSCHKRHTDVLVATLATARRAASRKPVERHPGIKE